MKPTRVVPLAVVALLAIGLAAALPHLAHRGPGRGEAFVTMHGVALVVRSSGARDTVRGRTTLHPGDVLQMQAGLAGLELADGVGYEARAATADAAASKLRMGDQPSLLDGQLLVTAEHGARVQMAETAVSLAGHGAMRLARGLATGVGVYEGRAVIDSAGATGQVPALRSLEVAAAGDVPQRPQPISYSADDAWDREYLGDAISIDGQLRSLLAAFQASGGRPDEAALALRPDLADAPSASALRRLLKARHDASGKLVGTAITGLSHGGPFDRRWADVFAFRDDGAPWGLVAMDHAVGPDDLVNLLAKVIDVTSFAFADTGGVKVADRSIDRATPATGSGTSTGSGTGTGPGGTGTGSGSGGGGGTGTGSGGGGGTGTGGGTLPGGGTVPPVTLPGVTIPGVTNTLPPVDVPVTVPGITVGPVTIPPISLPPVTLPAVTLPVTIPTIPKVTVPPLTLPVTLPPILGLG